MAFDDGIAKRNAMVLATAGALAGANASVVFATSALVGQALGPSPAWATAPATSFVLGTALATMPAAFLMRRIGRRAAYQFGTAIGVIAGLCAALSIREGAFYGFLMATMMCGFYHAFVTSYRFGAADTASPAYRPKVVSWVLAGGVASAFVGPQLVIFTKDITPPHQFMASYVGQAMVAGLAMFALLAFRNAPVIEASTQAPARPLSEILKSRRLVLAIGCAAIAQSLMNYIMTASPLAMIGCNHTTTEATLAIQWHIIGMFLPGFFTGHLINRFGVYRIMALGLVMLAACGIIAISGITVAHFFAALIMLGVGWNFTFIGASSLVAEGQRANERNKVQGFTDLVVFSVTAFGSLMAGKVLAAFGWVSLNLVLFPFIVAAAVMIYLLAKTSPTATPAE